MKLSIIIPVYNRETTIEKCIDSLINQLDSDCEIILVDDGSSDNTISICRRYLNNQIKLIENEHGGVSKARNTGIKEALGEYIAFIDSDDFVDDNYISIIKSAIEDSPQFVAFDAFEFLVDGKPYRKNAGLTVCDKTEISNIYPFLISQRINNAVLKLFRADIIRNNNIKFIDGMIIAEDYMFIMDYVKVCDSVKICNYLPYYFVYNTSGTYNVNPNHLLNLITAYENTRKFYNDYCQSISIIPMRARFLQQCVETCGKLCEKRLMTQELEKALTDSLIYKELVNADYTKLKSKIEKIIFSLKKWHIAKYYFHTIKLLEKIINNV